MTIVPSQAVDRLLLDGYLKELRLPTFARNYEAYAEDAAQTGQSYQRFLLALAQQELTDRANQRQLRRIKEAALPHLKELQDFNFSLVPSLSARRVIELSQGGYINQAEPIIMVGNPGLGKTHVAISLALAACRQQHRVRFYNVASLVNDLTAAQNAGRLQRFLTTALRHQLIVLDELGFIPFSPSAAQLIFQFCSALHERVALIITTNLKFADWTQIFGDERLTLALLDRLTHHAHILEFIGESYRFRQRLQKEAPLEAEHTSLASLPGSPANGSASNT
jgi:DNA replication protein DnaC